MDNGSYPLLTSLKSEGISLLIFDLDGTILDSMNIWNQVDIEFLGRYGYEVTSEYTDMVKRVSIEDAARYTAERYKLPLTPQQVQDTWNQMVGEFYRNEVELKEGALDYLSEARRAGFKMGVATALNRTNCFNALRKNGILELFDAVITLEDTGKNTDKSSPDIFLKVLGYINAMGNNVAPGGALVFDDVPSACRGARSGSFKTCAVYDDIGCGKDNWNLFASSCDYSISKW